MPILKTPWLIMLLVMATTIGVYAGGLSGPFLFDDHVHISQNRWVKIESLSWDNLVQAWNSSFSAFPSNRPLSQLSFGVNHALAGLNPWAFKATNLLIHLLTGITVFVFSRLAFRATAGPSADQKQERIFAAMVAAFWLLHPLQVSTVLYTVQRMAQLSSLSLLLALTVYFRGRLEIANNGGGRGWILAAAPIAIIGFLGKENTVLLPLLLLASELTLLRNVSFGDRRTFMRGVWIVFIALPLLAGFAYILTHPGLLTYQGRPFTLDERLLTQPRVLWLYLRWLFVPDVSAFGLFHDDIAVSTGVLSPPTTALALLGWVVLMATAVIYRSRAPLFAFATLFFLASHALESSVFPLEMVFEHRNYLASVGPLMLLAYLITITSERFKVRSSAVATGALLLLSYTFVTFVRVGNWSSYENFILSSVENHPGSARSNFMAGQLLISAVAKSERAEPKLAEAARTHLRDGIAVDPRCINCMFGLMVLELYQGRQPGSALVAGIGAALRSGYVGPTKVSVGQFSHLVKLQKRDGTKLPAKDFEAIFDAALENPAWNGTGRAGIEAAYREYYEFVVQDLPSALIHAQGAVASWPDQWSYHMQLVRILRKLGRPDDALAALEVAAPLAGNDAQQLETAEVRNSIELQ